MELRYLRDKAKSVCADLPPAAQGKAPLLGLHMKRFAGLGASDAAVKHFAGSGALDAATNMQGQPRMLGLTNQP